MTKENFQKLKRKEAQLQTLIERKDLIENGVMNSINYTITKDSGVISNKEIKGSDLPKGAIKSILLEIIEKRIAHAKAEWESFFDDNDMFGN